MTYKIRLRNANYCRYKCIQNNVIIPDNTSIPAIEQNTGLQQIKVQNGGGTPQFRKYSINQFGRYVGTGGKKLSNFR